MRHQALRLNEEEKKGKFFWVINQFQILNTSYLCKDYKPELSSRIYLGRKVWTAKSNLLANNQLSNFYWKRESAAENNYHASGKGENVR